MVPRALPPWQPRRGLDQTKWRAHELWTLGFCSVGMAAATKTLELRSSGAVCELERLSPVTDTPVMASLERPPLEAASHWSIVRT
jgi:hypothetical protein